MRAGGMEFASEMIVKASLADLRISEVPTTLRPDGRSRAPHLRSFRDGWRHLRFLLLFCPYWLFVVPGLVLFAVGVIGTTALTFGHIGGLDIAGLLYAASLVIIGYQALWFGLLMQTYAESRGILPEGHTHAADPSAPHARARARSSVSRCCSSASSSRSSPCCVGVPRTSAR